MQTLPFGNLSRADHVSLVYAFSKALFSLKIYVHIIHCKEYVVYVSPDNSFSIPSVLFLLCSVSPYPLFLH